MDTTSELYIWALNFLLVIGVLLIPIGLGFIFVPDKLFKVAARLNRWIMTDHFFDKINKPIYKERFFYRHHRIFGIFIILFSLFCIYMLTVYIGMGSMTVNLEKLAESEFEKWLFVILYYLLLVAVFLTLIFGLIMFLRPSALKSFESWSNHWIDAETPLKVLDREKDLPDRFLLGNPRIFGLLIVIAAIYIILSVIRI